MSLTKKYISLPMLALVCASCATKLERTSFYDTCTIGGVSYDVHSAVKTNVELGSAENVRVLVPKGKSPKLGNVIATCSADKTDSQCKDVFRKAIQKKQNEQNSSSDY